MASAYVKSIGGADFDAEVVKSPQPVIVDFWAEWCGPCKMLAPVLDEIAEEKKGALKVVKIDVDQNQELAQQFGIKSIPTLMIYKGGEKKEVMVGVTSKKDILKRIEALG